MTNGDLARLLVYTLVCFVAGALLALAGAGLAVWALAVLR
jgi:hypothetical protein